MSRHCQFIVIIRVGPLCLRHCFPDRRPLSRCRLRELPIWQVARLKLNCQRKRSGLAITLERMKSSMGRRQFATRSSPPQRALCCIARIAALCATLRRTDGRIGASFVRRKNAFSRTLSFQYIFSLGQFEGEEQRKRQTQSWVLKFAWK